jgi:hypothetical protein
MGSTLRVDPLDHRTGGQSRRHAMGRRAKLRFGSGHSPGPLQAAAEDMVDMVVEGTVIGKGEVVVAAWAIVKDMVAAATERATMVPAAARARGALPLERVRQRPPLEHVHQRPCWACQTVHQTGRASEVMQALGQRHRRPVQCLSPREGRRARTMKARRSCTSSKANAGSVVLLVVGLVRSRLDPYREWQILNVLHQHSSPSGDGALLWHGL